MQPRSSDIQIIQTFYNELINHPQLQRIFNGDVRVYYHWAEPNAPLPYIVHTIDSSPVDSVVRTAEYRLDIWDYSDTADRIDEIRYWIHAIFDNRVLNVAHNGMCIRINNRNWTALPVDADNMWRLTSVWDVRYTAYPELQGILSRRQGGK